MLILPSSELFIKAWVGFMPYLTAAVISIAYCLNPVSPGTLNTGPPRPTKLSVLLPTSTPIMASPPTRQLSAMGSKPTWMTTLPTSGRAAGYRWEGDDDAATDVVQNE